MGYYYVRMTTARPELADGTWDSIKTGPHKELAASRVKSQESSWLTGSGEEDRQQCGPRI